MDNYRKKLPPDVYDICWNKATEAPFSGEYNKHFESGDYYCVCCDNKLFSSAHKYDSGSGWPSFWQQAATKAVKLQSDNSHLMIRTEVLCHNCGAHLGHVFTDGPQPTHQRYCINSKTMTFKAK